MYRCVTVQRRDVTMYRMRPLDVILYHTRPFARSTNPSYLMDWQLIYLSYYYNLMLLNRSLNGCMAVCCRRTVVPVFVEAGR